MAHKSSHQKAHFAKTLSEKIIEMRIRYESSLFESSCRELILFLSSQTLLHHNRLTFMACKSSKGMLANAINALAPRQRPCTNFYEYTKDGKISRII